MSALEWINKVCPYCETEYGTYSDGDKYGEHECDGIRIESLEARIKELEAENKKLLNTIESMGTGMWRAD